MSSSSQRLQVKLTIAKLISFAYDQDKKLVAEINRERAPFTLTLNQHGDVEIEASAGKLRFTIDQKKKPSLASQPNGQVSASVLRAIILPTISVGT